MADPMLKRAVNVLLGLQMLSEGKTMRLDKERTSSTGERRLPVSFTRDGDLRERELTPFEFHADRIHSSSTPVDLAERVMAAERALRAARGHRDSLGDEIPRKPGELRLYVLIDCEGMRSIDVAEKTGMSLNWVRTLRVRSKRHPNTGEPLDGN